MMKLINLLILLFIFSSCSSFKFKNDEKADVNAVLEVEDKTEQIPATQFPLEYTISAGQVKKITFSVSYEDRSMKLVCDGKEIPFDFVDSKLRAYYSLGYHSTAKSIKCELELGGEKVNVANFKVVPIQYQEETLKVKKKHVELNKKDLERFQKEMELQKIIYGSSRKEKGFFDAPFVSPLDSVVTSEYGKKRVFNKKLESWHSGTDFRAATGTPIPAANKGKVVFAGELFFNGNAVIIDHGLDIFTMYCHLSKLSVQEGEIIPQGTIIGEAGATGRVTGPHLHWGVKVGGEWVSGLQFVEEEKQSSKF